MTLSAGLRNSDTPRQTRRRNSCSCPDRAEITCRRRRGVPCDALQAARLCAAPPWAQRASSAFCLSRGRGRGRNTHELWCFRLGSRLASDIATRRLTSLRAQPDIAGKSCPYCRFPLKEGTDVTVCPSCASPHHADCWNDNAGCAIIGCTAGPNIAAHAPTTEPPTRRAQVPPAPVQPQPTPPPSLPPRPRDHARSAVLVGALVCVAVLGGALAYAIGKGSARSATTTDVITTATSSTQAAATAGTSTNRPPSEAKAENAPPTRPTLLTYQGTNYSIMVPAGWPQVADEVARGEEAESKWSNPSRQDEYVLVDVHSPTHLTSQQDAEPVREDLEKSPEYREEAYESGDLSHTGSWMWVFGDEHSQRIDYFFETCSNTVAVLGSAPPARFDEDLTTFREVADSFASSCE